MFLYFQLRSHVPSEIVWKFVKVSNNIRTTNDKIDIAFKADPAQVSVVSLVNRSPAERMVDLGSAHSPSAQCVGPFTRVAQNNVLH
jgi:hypothetical protein